jgi:hypothetical protein
MGINSSYNRSNANSATANDSYFNRKRKSVNGDPNNIIDSTLTYQALKEANPTFIHSQQATLSK